jgi:hypothetical protein
MFSLISLKVLALRLEDTPQPAAAAAFLQATHLESCPSSSFHLSQAANQSITSSTLSASLLCPVVNKEVEQQFLGRGMTL